MPTSPDQPKIYHITHVDNLPSIISEGALLSDATMVKRGGPDMEIGMSSIKLSRLSLPVRCHQGDKVCDYVPFYFCPRSVMLYVIYRANHPELTYRGGQGPIVHLEADLHSVVAWADANGRRWAFSLSNAGARYTEFRDSLDDLDEINWPAVAALDFQPSHIKEGKQAEFLMHDAFPWELVERIGVFSRSISVRTQDALAEAAHRPRVEIRPDWYY